MKFFIEITALSTLRLAQVALLGILAVVMGEVVSRYIFNSPTQTSLEITEYLIVTIGFLPLAFIYKTKGHVSVELVLDLLPTSFRKKLVVVSHLIVAGFSFIVCGFGADITFHAYGSGIASSSLMAFPMWIAYLPIPLGFLALGMQAVVSLIQSAAEEVTS